MVFQEQSKFQEIVVTEDGDGVRTLRFGADGVVQSRALMGHPETLLVPYVRASMVGLGLVQAPRRVLVVGLGGGSIPKFLYHALPQVEVDAVDIDPVVVDVARQWFEVPGDARSRLWAEDGRAFVERVSEPYDLVFLDAFGEDSIPVELTSREFLLSVRDAVAQDGVVIANVWSGASNPLYESMLATYQAVFGDLWVFAVPRRNNRIVVAPAKVTAREELERRVVAAEKALSVDWGLQELVRKGEIIAADAQLPGVILID